MDFKAAPKSNFSDTASHSSAQASSTSGAKASSTSAAHDEHKKAAHSGSGEDSGAESDGSDILEGCKRRRRHRLDDSDDEDRVRRRPREGSVESGEENGHVAYEKNEDVGEKHKAGITDHGGGGGGVGDSLVVDRVVVDQADKKRAVRQSAATKEDSFASVVDVKLLRNEITRLRNLNQKVLLELHPCLYVCIASTQVSSSWLRSDICNDTCLLMG